MLPASMPSVVAFTIEVRFPSNVDCDVEDVKIFATALRTLSAVALGSTCRVESLLLANGDVYYEHEWTADRLPDEDTPVERVTTFLRQLTDDAATLAEFGPISGGFDLWKLTADGELEWVAASDHTDLAAACAELGIEVPADDQIDPTGNERPYVRTWVIG